MQLKQEELKTAIILWPNQGSGVASYGAKLGHWARASSNFGNSMHSAAIASLTVKILKITKEKHVLHFRLSPETR